MGLRDYTTAAKDHVKVLLRGGLANQMFQYALGLALAENSGRQVFVDVAYVVADAKRVYSLEACSPTPQRLSSTNCFLMRLARSTTMWDTCGRRWSAIVPGGSRIIREQGEAFDPRVLSLSGSLILDGYWQSEEYFKHCRPLIEETFDWTAIARPKVSEPLLQAIETTDSVGVHVRRGDYVREPATNAFHGVCEPDYYRRAAKIIEKRVANPHFFIFSDDIDWAESNLKLPGKQTAVRHAQDTIPHVEMWLMSRCKHTIIANSSYSWWAAWLTERPGKCIVAPQTWFTASSMQGITPVPERWCKA